MGQRRELGIVEIFFFKQLCINCFLFFYLMVAVLSCIHTNFPVSPSRQAWDRCPFLALDQELDFRTCSNTVWTKCSGSYFVYNYNRVLNIIVVIFVCFLKNKYFVYSELLYYNCWKSICYHWVVTMIGHTKESIQLLLNIWNYCQCKPYFFFLLLFIYRGLELKRGENFFCILFGLFGSLFLISGFTI